MATDSKVPIAVHKPQTADFPTPQLESAEKSNIFKYPLAHQGQLHQASHK